MSRRAYPLVSFAILAVVFAACREEPTATQSRLRPDAGLTSVSTSDYGAVTELIALTGSATDPVDAMDINAAGDVVGASWVGRDSLGRPQMWATLWPADGGPPRALPAPSGTTRSSASGINDAGDVVGRIDGLGGVLWPRGGGAPRILTGPTRGNGLAAINNSGDVAGTVAGSDAQEHAMVWPADGGPPRALRAPSGTRFTSSIDINDHGDVLGFSYTEPDSRGDVHRWATVWPADGGEPRQLVGLDGNPERAHPYTINGRGDVVGISYLPISPGLDHYLPHATLWPGDGGPPRELPGVCANSGAAYGINDAGDVVGVVSIPIPFSFETIGRVVLWPADGTRPRDLRTFGRDTRPVAINSAGYVVAVRKGRAMRLAPASWSAMGYCAPRIEKPAYSFYGVEGGTVGFEGVRASDPDGDALSYLWNFGDGTTSTDAQPTHVYADNSTNSWGHYSGGLAVTDPAGDTASTWASISIANAPPVVNVGPDTTVVAGRSFSHRNTTFSDAGVLDSPWRYQIDWGDGTGRFLTGDPLTTQGALPARNHTYWNAGTYPLSITVIDKDGGAGTGTRTINVIPNEVPVASANGPYAAAEGAAIVFSSAGTTDGNSDVLRYKWDFGDGTTSTSANPTKRYADNGTYTVTLTVTDPSNASTTATTSAVVANLPPRGSFSAASSVEESVSYTLKVNSPYDAGTVDRTSLEFAFDCGTGAGYGPWSTTATSVVCPAQPDQLAAPAVTRGKIRDKDGGEIEFTKNLAIINAAPLVTFGATTPTTIPVGGSVTFQASFSDKGVNDQPWTYAVIWADGTLAASGSALQQGDLGPFTHIYKKAGTFNTYIKITDKDGRSKSSIPVAITVTP